MEKSPFWPKQNPNNTNYNTRHYPHHRRDHIHLRASGSTGTAYPNVDDSSWEEQAFADDATGAFGSVWPPRSYSCSFCMREFRSAQALGGHMNVHRRDRARLKQSSPPTSQSQRNDLVDQNHRMGFQYQNPSFGHDPGLASSWPSRVCDHDQENQRVRSPTTWANFVVGRHNNTSEFPKPNNKVAKNLNFVKADLSVSLSLVLHDPSDHEVVDDEEAMRSCKKRKMNDGTDDDSSFSIFLKPKIQALDRPEAEEDGPELDLELRLGTRSS